MIDDIVKGLQADDIFQSYLRAPIVQEALEHWLNITRLPSEVAEEKFNDNHQVLLTFGKLKNLQEACLREQVKFPVELFLLHPPVPPKSTQKPLIETADSSSSSSSELPPPPTPPLPAGLLRAPGGERRKSSTSNSIRFDPQLVKEFRFKKHEEDAIPTLLSLSPANLTKWWAIQCFILGFTVMVYFSAFATSME